ncbi:MAG: LPS-assembly protein LptD [Muribaculaceae bacterium]|nr:LPS-assembly protein LptD [Muribaculaceae bacterium]
MVGLAYSRTESSRPRSGEPESASDADTTVSDDFVSLADSIEGLESNFDIEADTLEVALDSLREPEALNEREPLDTARGKISKIRYDKVDIDNVVHFSAKDSLILIGQDNAYLYGNSTIDYSEFKVNADQIRMEMDSSTVYAAGRIDSTGVVTGNPIFKDKGGEYESKTMKYNFKSERGFITDVITEQQDGYLTGGKAKKMEDGSFYVEDGRYTTCDDHDDPHFYFQLTRAKVRPKKDVVTGPGYMVLMGIPLPLALPFGYFPFSEKYSSGVIFPSFGDDYNKGFYLRDGGYYFAINDNVDLALRGEIYTKGSWCLTGHSSYVKRYRFRGSFDVSFLQTITGDKGTPDYMKMKNFQVIWSHSQDQKANPNLSFSASVNFATSGYSRNDLNSYYNNSFTENTKSSTVNLTYRIPNSKWSFSATANITQRSQDSTLAVSFPNLNVSMSQLAPFKRKKAVGGEKWYEKIRLSYSGQFQNSLTSPQNVFFQKSLLKDWRNGLKHYVPVSATFSLFKYINLSPSITLNDRMYTSKIRRQWDDQASREVQDTTFGFYNIFDFNASLSFDTKVYGFYKPLKIFGDKVQMIRHVMTPTVSFNWQPDFGNPMWGAYDYYVYTDQAGYNRRVDYSYFSHGIFGVPGRGKSGAVTWGLSNNLEMKVKSEADSTGVKKISLIENLSFSQSYNFAADSLRLSPMQANILLRLVKNFNLNLNTSWDPYIYRLNESGSPYKADRLRIQEGKGLFRLASAGTSFSYTFNNDTFRRKNENADSQSRNSNDLGDDYPDNEEEDAFTGRTEARRRQRYEDTEEAGYDGYAKWECPWSLSVNYSVSYGYGAFNPVKMEYDGRWNQNLSFNGSIRPTKNWNFSFSASYDFDAKKLAYMNCSISRDLHCFTMTAAFVPVGPYKSYNFHIAVKSSLLKDLKYDKRSSANNGIKWY